MRRGQDLIRRGYFTGMNFIRSDVQIPNNALIVHFLHDSREHLDFMIQKLERECLVLPRLTCYETVPAYFSKPGFKDEYRDALFFDSNMVPISIEQAIRAPEGAVVLRQELDLIVPLDEDTLRDSVTSLREADELGPRTWVDPVFIVRNRKRIVNLDGFVERQFVSIARENEEIYTVLGDRNRTKALERYLDKLCSDEKIGTLARSDVVFRPSQVNEEFAKYILNAQKELLA
jgi:hypothetical protein